MKKFFSTLLLLAVAVSVIVPAGITAYAAEGDITYGDGTITRVIYEEDFTQDTSVTDSIQTVRGGLLTTGASVTGLAITNGAVNWTDPGANYASTDRLYYKMPDGGAIHEVKPNRTYTYKARIGHNLSAGTDAYIQVYTVGKGVFGESTYSGKKLAGGVTGIKDRSIDYTPLETFTGVDTVYQIFFDGKLANATWTLDSLTITETYSGYPVTVTTEGNGKVMMGDEALSGKTPFETGNATLKIVPDEGYAIDSVTYGGQAVEPNNSGEITIAVNAAAELKAVFKADEAETSVSVTSHSVEPHTGGYYEFTDVSGVTKKITSDYSIILYGYVSGDAADYGFRLSKEGGSNSFELKSTAAPVNGAFAIRVTGNGIQTGNYSAVPYWTAEGEAEGTPYTVSIQ